MVLNLVVGIVAAASVFAPPALAQSPNGYGSILTIPVVVESSTYGSAVFVHNVHTVALTVKPDYVGADGSATVGAVSCPAIVVPANTVSQYSLPSLCTLNPGSNFGRLQLVEQNTDTRPFAAYSRVETFSGNGFSIEGFPIGNFVNAGPSPGGLSYITGLRRLAASPGYQTNCFLSSLNEPVTVDYSVETGAGTPLGTTQTVFLAANQMVRLLDVFATAGAPAGDYTNARVRLVESGSLAPGFVAFCTVQNNVSFDADFRIAKNSDPNDQGRGFTGLALDNTLATIRAVTPFDDDIYQVFWQHPDWVRCFVSAATPTNLELRVLNPAGVVVAGGDNIFDTGKFFLGERSTVNNGANGVWRIEVGAAVSGATDFYQLICTAGNGGSDPLFVTRQPAAF